MAEAMDREWGTEGYSNVAFLQLLNHACARLAKGRLAKSQFEDSGQRLILPRVMKIASSKAPAKATSAPGFSRSRSPDAVQRAIARRMALR